MQVRLSKSDRGMCGVSTLTLGSRAEHVITVCGQDEWAMERALRAETQALHARMLSRFVFCGGQRSAAFERPLAVREQGVVWLKAEDIQPVQLASMQAFAVSGTTLVPVQDHGCATGFIYEDDAARYCRLSGVIPRSRTASRDVQAREVFETLDTVLTQHGFRFTDTVRTWFYLDHLLDWYSGFNAVRTAFFEERGVFAHMVPASTGIGAGNPFGAALTCDLLAIQPKAEFGLHPGRRAFACRRPRPADERRSCQRGDASASPASTEQSTTESVRIQAVPSPMQPSALTYKSSFSRGVEAVFPTHRTLMISGTASIDAEGKTACVNDAAGQVSLTMEVVAALLKSRGMDWRDVTRGIAYFANPADSGLLGTYRRRHDLPGFPLAVAHATVCRKDLLFEIEVDAVQMPPAPRNP